MSHTLKCHYFTKFQEETVELKTGKDVSHSNLEDLDTEDLYVKFKVRKLHENDYKTQFST